MKKTSLLMFAFGACTLVAGSTGFVKKAAKELNTNFIVTLKTAPEAGQEMVELSQKQFRQDLFDTIGFGYELKTTYKHSINGFVIKANEADKELLQSIPNVESVVEDQTYFFAETQNYKAEGLDYIDETIYLNSQTPTNNENASDPTVNHSLPSMNIQNPETMAGGEGTLVAVLDSGFLLNHNAFKGMDQSVQVRLTEQKVKDTFATGQLHAKYYEGITDGEDKKGNLRNTDQNTYYNSKIPFQYDYGGTIYTQYNPDTKETEYFSDRRAQNKVKADDIFPDGNAYSPYSDHGTHVAGIIAAHDTTSYASQGSYDGVAPKAQLALMKVFTDNVPVIINVDEKDGPLEIPGTGASDSVILSALEDAIILDVDAINMSLGQDLNDFDTKSASFAAFKRLREKGTFVNVSAGNNGKQLYGLMGPYAGNLTEFVEGGTIGSYANSEDAMVIGSGMLDVQHFEKAVLVKGQALAYDDQLDKEKSPELGDKEKLLENLEPEADGKHHYIYLPGYGDSKTYDKLEDMGIGRDLHGKIAVVDRGGGVTFIEKIQNATNEGAKAVMIVNNDPGATDFNMRMDLQDYTSGKTVPVVMVLNKDMPLLKEGIDPATLEGTLEIITNQDILNPNKGRLSEFSTDGATTDLRIKPDIVAPGSVVKGPVPGKTGYTDFKFIQDKAKYDYLSGTSMSCPNFTGAIALMLSEYNVNRADRIDYAKSLAMKVQSTATLKSSGYKDEHLHNVDYNSLYGPHRQGAGFISVQDAIDTMVYLEGNVARRSKIELYNNEKVANGILELEFDIYNETKSELTYTPTVYVTVPDTFKYSENPADEIIQPGKPGNEEGKEPITRPGKWDFPEFKDVTLTSVNNRTIKEVSLKNITVPTGKTHIKLDQVVLTAEEKANLQKTFPNGNLIEGYVVLKPTESSKQITGVVDQLNIPYLGFFGDYFAQEIIEPFNFEKEEGKLYGSDVLHTLAKRTGAQYADYETMVRGMKLSDLTSNQDGLFVDNLQQMWGNKQSMKTFTEELTTEFNKDTGRYTIYAGARHKTDCLFFQAFVNRNIAYSGIKLIEQKTNTDRAIDVFPYKDPETGKTSSMPRFYTPLYGADELGIAKSFVSSNWIGTIMAHRANAFLPLYDFVNNRPFPDGKYTLELTFKAQASVSSHLQVADDKAIQTKVFDVVIDSTPAEVAKVKFVEIDTIKYLEIYVTEKDIKGIHINAGNIDHGEVVKNPDTGLYKTLIKVDDLLFNSPERKLFVEIEDKALNKNRYLTYLDSKFVPETEYQAVWLEPGFESVLGFEISKDEYGNDVLTYNLKLTNYYGEEVEASAKNPLIITIDASHWNMETIKDVTLYSVAPNGLTRKIRDASYDPESKTITMTLTGNNFQIVGELGSEPIQPEKPDIGPDVDPDVDPDVPVTPDTPSNSANLGAIIGGTCGGLVAVAGIGLGVFFVLKKKKAGK